MQYSFGDEWKENIIIYVKGETINDDDGVRVMVYWILRIMLHIVIDLEMHS